MASFLDKLKWILRKAAKSIKDGSTYYIENPREALRGLWEFIKENKLILGGILVIVVPLAIGFGPAGPLLGSIAAGWQSGIGVVAAGSLFATIQSLAMTGVFTGTGAGLISAGILKLIRDFRGFGDDFGDDFEGWLLRETNLLEPEIQHDDILPQ